MSTGNKPYEIRDGRIVVTGTERGPDGRKKPRGNYADNAAGRIRAARKVVQVMNEQKRGGK